MPTVDSATSSTWFLLRLTSKSPHLPPSDALLRKGQTGVPARHFSAGFTQSVLVYHHAAFQPSEEDETVAPFVFNCGWLGHGKNSVGGSSLTFLWEHHQNHSRKTEIGTKQMSRTKQQPKAPDSSQTNRLDIKHVMFSFIYVLLTVQEMNLKKSTSESCRGMRHERPH